MIRDLPEGRLRSQPLETGVWRDEVYQFVRGQSTPAAGLRLPLLESASRSQGGDRDVAHLAGEVFPTFKVGLLHGRMKQDAKDRVMKAFAAGELQILVSTTVVEVGIDVPNASVMIVEHAERFGLSQLHQLRGRVGRDRHQSFCFLLFQALTDDASA
jgi:ATP-dependent DNA helicase RecG